MSKVRELVKEKKDQGKYRRLDLSALIPRRGQDDRDVKVKSAGPMASLSGIVNQNTIYRFRLTSAGTVATGGGTAIALTVTLDPTGYSEFSSLSALFSEIRVVKSVLHVSNYFDESTPSPKITTGMAIGFNLAYTSTAATSSADVWALAGSRIHPLYGLEIGNYVAGIPTMEWATMSSPVPGPYAGCYGVWWAYAGSLTTSRTYATWFVETEYECRARQ